jgi:hypothetical protein
MLSAGDVCIDPAAAQVPLQTQKLNFATARSGEGTRRRNQRNAQAA